MLLTTMARLRRDKGEQEKLLAEAAALLRREREREMTGAEGGLRAVRLGVNMERKLIICLLARKARSRKRGHPYPYTKNATMDKGTCVIFASVESDVTPVPSPASA